MSEERKAWQLERKDRKKEIQIHKEIGRLSTEEKNQGPDSQSL